MCTCDRQERDGRSRSHVFSHLSQSGLHPFLMPLIFFDGISIAVFISRSGDDGSGNEDCLFDDPFLEDGFGNLTEWRLSDLKKDFLKHLEDESSRARTRERKHPKEQKMKLHNDLMEQYMQSALKKYNTEESIDGVCDLFYVFNTKFSFLKN